MNKQGRKFLEIQLGILEGVQQELTSIKDEEEGKFDNMPEGFQNGEKGEAMQAGIDNLDTAIDNVDEAISALNEIIGG
jgi:hypothetical protein